MQQHVPPHLLSRVYAYDGLGSIVASLSGRYWPVRLPPCLVSRRLSLSWRRCPWLRLPQPCACRPCAGCSAPTCISRRPSWFAPDLAALPPVTTRPPRRGACRTTVRVGVTGLAGAPFAVEGFEHVGVPPTVSH